MKRACRWPALIAAVLLAGGAAGVLSQSQPAGAEPDYTPWNAILGKYDDPARGMDYARLKAQDAYALKAFREQLGRVKPASLDSRQRLAYWINVYNVNVVATIVESYPVRSIRDLSTDPIIRFNVFKKDRVPFSKGTIALDDVEDHKIREWFHDPRIHFAINCAARSCPPLRREAYVGARLDAQLDDQVRTFLAGPNGARFETKGNALVVHLTKIMDWFEKDFDEWGGGKKAFLMRFLPADQQRQLAAAGKVDFEFDDYDWTLNDWRR